MPMDLATITLVYDERSTVRTVRAHLVDMTPTVVTVRTVGRPQLPAEATAPIVVVLDGDGDLVPAEFVLTTRMPGGAEDDDEGRTVLRLAREPRRRHAHR